jgi:hypothetical protein
MSGSESFPADKQSQTALSLALFAVNQSSKAAVVLWGSYEVR